MQFQNPEVRNHQRKRVTEQTIRTMTIFRVRGIPTGVNVSFGIQACICIPCFSRRKGPSVPFTGKGIIALSSRRPKSRYGSRVGFYDMPPNPPSKSKKTQGQRNSRVQPQGNHKQNCRDTLKGLCNSHGWIRWRK